MLLNHIGMLLNHIGKEKKRGVAGDIATVVEVRIPAIEWLHLLLLWSVRSMHNEPQGNI
jgi:hypothetical protein